MQSVLIIDEYAFTVGHDHAAIGATDDFSLVGLQVRVFWAVVVGDFCNGRPDWRLDCVVLRVLHNCKGDHRSK